MLSIWEKESFVAYDYILVGGGISGLSTAASLAELRPDARILLLERGLLPSGASTKNAGFACFGSLSELADDLDFVNEATLVETVAMRYRGICRLRERLGDQKIGYLPYGGYELIDEAHLPLLDKIPYFNELLSEVFSSPYFGLANDRLAHFGFSPQHVKALVHAPHEGQLDTGLMIRHLQGYVREKGVEILTGCQVEAATETDEWVEVRAKAIDKQEICFKARGLGWCTNAFSKRFLPELDLKPGRGQVLVTQPIAGLQIRGSFHMEEGYYYFRDHGDRLVFGGGRQLDFKGEQTEEMGLSEAIQTALLDKLTEVILPQTPFKVDYAWSGIMAFGKEKKPIVKMVSPRMGVGARMGGMGVAIGSMVGELLAKELAGLA